MNKYSESTRTRCFIFVMLIRALIRYFKGNCGTILSLGKATNWLHSIVQLYYGCVKIVQITRGGLPSLKC